jgi:hypothetical protein
MPRDHPGYHGSPGYGVVRHIAFDVDFLPAYNMLIENILHSKLCRVYTTTSEQTYAYTICKVLLIAPIIHLLVATKHFYMKKLTGQQLLSKSIHYVNSLSGISI